MGPLMNIALAFVLTWVVLLRGAEVPAYLDRPPVVGEVAAGSPAERAGIQPGDRIVRIAGRQVTTWEEAGVAIGSRARREVAIELVRGGETRTLRVTPSAEGKYEVGNIGVLPDVHPVIRSLVAGDPAEKAGMRPGDLVVAVGGEAMRSAGQLSIAIARHANEPIVVSIRRKDAPMDVIVTPALRGTKGMIGIQIGEETKTIEPGPIKALELSLKKNYEYGGLIFQTLGGLLTRETSPRQLMGPVAIAQLSGEYAALGWVPLFSLMAMISLNLGILNLLPIPVLDGGHIFIMALEAIARRDFSARMKEAMLLAGFVLLMLLMVTVIYNDLMRIQWVQKLVFWR